MVQEFSHFSISISSFLLPLNTVLRNVVCFCDVSRFLQLLTEQVDTLSISCSYARHVSASLSMM